MKLEDIGIHPCLFSEVLYVVELGSGNVGADIYVPVRSAVEKEKTQLLWKNFSERSAGSFGVVTS